MTKGTDTEETIEELRARQGRLAADLKADSTLRSDLEAVEEEIARRSVRESRDARAADEEWRRSLGKMTDAELEKSRTVIGGTSGPVARDQLSDVVAEQRRREATRAEAAKEHVPDAEKAVRADAAAVEVELARLVDAVGRLRKSVGTRSNVRRAAFGELPSWGSDELRIYKRVAARMAIAIAQPPIYGWGDIGTFARTPLTKLI